MFKKREKLRFRKYKFDFTFKIKSTKVKKKIVFQSFNIVRLFFLVLFWVKHTHPSVVVLGSQDSGLCDAERTKWLYLHCGFLVFSSVFCEAGKENLQGTVCTPCKVGFWRDNSKNNRFLNCTECSVGFTTQDEGATSSGSCSIRESTFNFLIDIIWLPSKTFFSSFLHKSNHTIIGSTFWSNGQSINIRYPKQYIEKARIDYTINLRFTETISNIYRERIIIWFYIGRLKRKRFNDVFCVITL